MSILEQSRGENHNVHSLKLRHVLSFPFYRHPIQSSVTYIVLMAGRRYMGQHVLSCVNVALKC